MARTAPTGTDGPPLAEGIAQYVEIFRGMPKADTVAGTRLSGDMNAGRFDTRDLPPVDRFDTAIALPGREVAVRIYTPETPAPRRAICYFHGGGFAHGSIESFDIAAAALCHATGAIVASVQYRRLPESTYAQAQDDCDAAFAWLARNAALIGADPDRLVLAGDSVGALFALVCAANARDNGSGGPQPTALLLFYGAFLMDGALPDYATAADPMLTPERIAAFVDLFERNGGPQRGPAPAARADLAELPPTYIVAAEHDPLALDAGRMAQALAAAGVPVITRTSPGTIHGFLRAAGVSPPAREELRLTAEALQRMT